MKKLQSESSSPLYHQLMQRITDDIEKGRYQCQGMVSAIISATSSGVLPSVSTMRGACA